MTTIIESNNRIQLPQQWLEELGLHEQVILEKTADGILIRPARKLTWDEVFATKLQVGKPQIDPEDWQGCTDDLMF